MPRSRNRMLTMTRIKSISETGKSVTYEDGWSYLIPEDYADKIAVGTPICYETIQASRVTAWGIVSDDGADIDWAFKKTDEDLDAEDDEFHRKVQQDKEESWEKFKDEWNERMEALSEPFKSRMKLFLKNGGHAFELSGFGYELIICQLAEMLLASDGEETEEIKAWGSNQGLSGNQFDCAKWLVRVLKEQPDRFLEAPAGFTPITGDPYYLKAGEENG